MKYEDFLSGKTQSENVYGFKPVWTPDFLFDFQKALVEWALRKGRAAIFADCGLGKTPMQLVWAENVVRKENKPVLILTPLSVGAQTKRESDKFGIDAAQSHDGKLASKIVITNYEKIHLFNPQDFIGVVCDESSILKNFNGERKASITEFMRTRPYRLLCTATAAPNDFIELGTSAEALSEMGFMDMLARYFKELDDQDKHKHTRAQQFRAGKWRFRGHSENDFWRWVCSWARALRKPSDCGFDDGKFTLPELTTAQHTIKAKTPRAGLLFDLPAISLEEQREERRRSLPERCEKAAALAIAHKGPSVLWCHMNDEGNTLEKLITNSVQVSGADCAEAQEDKFSAFASGKVLKLITKPKIGGFGHNWQHCAHQTVFPSHSFEQYYQAVRRSWRFGQINPVHVDVITSEGESEILKSIQRKTAQAEIMFERLVKLMGKELKVRVDKSYTKTEDVPTWL